MLFNFARSEAYRALKMKCVWILAIVLFALCVITGFTYTKISTFNMMGVEDEELEQVMEDADYEKAMDISVNVEANNNNGEPSETGIQTGVTGAQVDSFSDLFGEGMLYKSTVAKMFKMNVTGMNAFLIMAIFAGLFAGDVYSTGVNKNNLKGMNHKGHVLAARVLVIAVYALFIQILMYAFSALTMAWWAKSLRFGFSAGFAVYFLVTYLGLLAFSVIVFAIASVTRSKAAAIAVGVVISQGFLTLLSLAVNHLINKTLGWADHFALSDYMLTANIQGLSVSDSTGDIIRVAVIAAIYLVVGYGIALIVSKKRDVA